MSLQNIMTWERPEKVCLKTSNESTRQMHHKVVDWNHQTAIIFEVILVP